MKLRYHTKLILAQLARLRADRCEIRSHIACMNADVWQARTGVGTIDRQHYVRLARGTARRVAFGIQALRYWLCMDTNPHPDMALLSR